MSRLRADNQTFYAKDAGTASDEQRKKLLDNFMAPDVLHLAKDAQVMLIKNCDETLVNGSMGRVVRFVDPQKYKDEVLDDAQFTNEKESKPVSKGASAKGSSARVDVQKWPVVEFVVPGGKREVMVMPETWKVELPNGEVQASRTQVCALASTPSRQTLIMPGSRSSLSSLRGLCQSISHKVRHLTVLRLTLLGFSRKVSLVFESIILLSLTRDAFRTSLRCTVARYIP